MRDFKPYDMDQPCEAVVGLQPQSGVRSPESGAVGGAFGPDLI